MRPRYGAFAPVVAIYAGFAAAFAALFLTGPLAVEPGWQSQLSSCTAVLRILRVGQLPFWNPWACGGTLLWQKPAVPLLSMVYPLALVLPIALAIKANVLLHATAAAIGLDLLLRARWSRSRPGTACVSAAIVLAGTALAVGVATDAVDWVPALLVPLCAYCVFRSRPGSFKFLVGGASLIAFIVFEGGLSITPFAVAAMVGTALVSGQADGTWSGLRAAVSILVIGCGLAAPRLVPLALLPSNPAAARAAADCSDPAASARSDFDGATIRTEGPVTRFDRTVSPNRVSERVVVGDRPGTLILEQNFADGWASNAGPVVPDGATGRPSIVLPAGYAGGVLFTFTPAGIWPGVVVFMLSATLAVIAWRRPADVAVLPAYLASWDVGIALIATAGFLWMYAHYPYSPTVPDSGWWNFWDQSQYLKSARALARGDFSGSEHWYPIGYSLLAAPFVRLARADPFFVVNLAAFVAFAWLYLRLFQPIVGGLAAVAAFCAALLWPWGIDAPPFSVPLPLWSQFAVPWNTNLVAPLYVGALVALRWNWRRHHKGVDALLGASLGLVACTRPTDAVPLGVLLAVYVAHAFIARRQIAPSLLVGAGALAFVGPALLFVRHAYSGQVPPYTTVAGHIGFSVSNLHERAYQIFLRSEDTYGEARAALFELQPWLYLAVPLAIVWALVEPESGGLPVVLVLSSWLLYLSFNDFSPFKILRYQLIHYILWTLPVIAAAGVAGAVAVIRTRRWRAALAVLVAAALAFSLRLVATTVAPAAVRAESLACCGTRYTIALADARPIDAIEMATTVLGENPMSLANKDIDVHVDGTTLDPLSGYQVLQRGAGIRIVFNRYVSAREVSFTLDRGFATPPDAARTARTIRFEPALRPFSPP